MSRVLVIQAESRLMNPLLDQEMIDAELEADRESASSEWLAQFRSSTVQFLDDELIEAAIVLGCHERPFGGHDYFAFADPSGGRHDSFTMSISHRDGERIVQDRLDIVAPPFVPDEIVERYCEVLKGYGLASVTGDRYAAEWVSAAFAKHGINYTSVSKDKSGIYVESLPLFTARNVELLDIPKLETELRLLERRPRAGGKGDIVDHPPRASDDAANATCGSLWLAAQELADDAAQVFPNGWIRASQERWKPEPPYGIPQCAIGVGIRGHCNPVIALRHDGWFAALIVVPSNETLHGRKLAAIVLQHRRDGAISVVDVGESLGGQAFTHLKENGIEAFALRSMDETIERTAERQMKFADKRSAAYWRFREGLDPAQDGGSPIALPNDPELVAQLEAVKWEQTSRGIKVESKEKIAARLLRPSNRADAVVAAWYKGARVKTHIQIWRPDERVGPMAGFKRRPKVNFGARRNAFLSRRRR